MAMSQASGTVNVGQIVFPSGEAIHVDPIGVKNVADLSERLQQMHGDKLVKVFLVTPDGGVLDKQTLLEFSETKEEGTLVTATVSRLKTEVAPGTLLAQMSCTDTDEDDDAAQGFGINPVCSFVVWPGMDPKKRRPPEHEPELATIPETQRSSEVKRNQEVYEEATSSEASLTRSAANPRSSTSPKIVATTPLTLSDRGFFACLRSSCSQQ